MSGDAVPTPKIDTSSGANFVSGVTGGTVSTDAQKDINYGLPGTGALATGIYNAVTKAITPATPNLQDPSAAGAPPTQSQVNNDALASTLANEKQAASSSSSIFLGAQGLDDPAPNSSSRFLSGY